MRWPFGPTRRRDDDLDDEIRAHFAMAIAERIKRGESPEEAAAAARREFGNVGHVKEVTRESWGGVWIERLVQDLRFTLRSLRRAPGFTAVAVITLALAIGVNTTMFTIVNGILLRPLPFRDENRLFLVQHAPAGPFTRAPAMYDGAYDTYSRATRLFERTTSLGRATATLSGAGDPVRLSVAGVSSGFFDVLGASPARGRRFLPDEERDSADTHVIISDALWHDRFGADEHIVGRFLDLDGVRRTIVGVMAPEFDFPSGTRMWYPAPVIVRPNIAQLRLVVGRLAPSATPEEALAELRTFGAAFDQKSPDPNAGRAIDDVVPIRQVVVGDVRRSLLLFEGAVAFVLLIACANVANLLLMRAAGRQHEITLRTALGASRPRLARQMLTESVVVAAIGGALGIGIAVAGVPALMSVAPPGLLPRTGDIRLDWSVFGAMALVSIVTGLVFGIAPALHATRRAIRSSLVESGQASTPRSMLRSAIVITELALALVLLVGAGLMTRSFLRLRSVDLGFAPEHLVTFTVNLPESRYTTIAASREFRRRTEGELARIPDVSGVGVVNWRPISQAAIMGDFHVEGLESPPRGTTWSLKPCVTPDYFRVMGIRVLSGRSFTPEDDERAPGVVIVSRSLAARIWPNESAVGKRITMSDKPGPNDWLTIVGVVSDIVQDGVTAAPSPAIYQALAQTRSKYFLEHLTFIARTNAEPGHVEREMRDALRAVDPAVAAEEVGTMSGLIESTIAEPLFQARLFAVFSLLAVVLAAVGIYGVLAYSVTERSREFGVRMALGAAPGAVLRLVLRRTAGIAAIGIGLGIAGAVAITRLLAKFLFGVTPTDLPTFIVVTAALMATAFIAALVPARRASRVDPLIAIRHE